MLHSMQFIRKCIVLSDKVRNIHSFVFLMKRRKNTHSSVVSNYMNWSFKYNILLLLWSTQNRRCNSNILLDFMIICVCRRRHRHRLCLVPTIFTNVFATKVCTTLGSFLFMVLPCHIWVVYEFHCSAQTYVNNASLHCYQFMDMNKTAEFNEVHNETIKNDFPSKFGHVFVRSPVSITRVNVCIFSSTTSVLSSYFKGNALISGKKSN